MTRRRWGRVAGPVITLVLLVGVLFLAVFPTRTYLAQRAATARAVEQLEVLRRESAALGDRAAALADDATLERLARERYHLVKPGEEAYAVLPPPRPEPASPEAAGDGARPASPTAAERLWAAAAGVWGR